MTTSSKISGMPCSVHASRSACEEAGLRRQQPLERLDDDAAQFVVMFVDQTDRHRRVVERRDDHLVAHAARDAGRIRHRLREVAGTFRCQAHQAVVAHAVIAALELQDLVAAAERAGDAHGVGVGLGAAADEAHLLGAGHRIDDGGGQRMPCSLLAKNVVPRGICACTAAITSGWQWPMNIGPEPSRKSTYSLPLTSQTRPPRPSRITMSGGRLPKLPAGQDTARQTRPAPVLHRYGGSSLIVVTPLATMPHHVPGGATASRRTGPSARSVIMKHTEL